MSVFIWGLFLLLCFVWSLSFLLAEILLESVSPFTIVFYRVFFASIIMLTLIKLLGKRFPQSLKNLFLLFLLGLTNNAIPFSAIVYGQQFITGGLASIINTNTAFFTLILSSLMFMDERLTLVRFLGIILGISGVIIAIGPTELLAFSMENLGQQCVIIATICYAISTTMARKFIKGVDPLVSVTVMLLSSAFWMGMIVLYMEGLPLFTPSAINIVSMGLLAALSTSLAYILYFILLERAGAGTTTLVTVLIPPFAMIMDAVILNQAITKPQMAGFVFVAVGVVMVARGLPKADHDLKISENNIR
jgi:drug/metabolite transporter (DMT)-like permease